MSARRTGIGSDRLNQRHHELSVDDRIEFYLDEHAGRRKSRYEQCRICWSRVGKELAMYLDCGPPIAPRGEKETRAENVLALAAEAFDRI
jgi:hypothetical protein